MLSPIKPKPGELWLHEHAGFVEIVRAWNANESVCLTVRGRRLLQNAFLAARIVEEPGGTFKAVLRDGQEIDVPPEALQIKKP